MIRCRPLEIMLIMRANDHKPIDGETDQPNDIEPMKSLFTTKNLALLTKGTLDRVFFIHAFLR